MNRDKRISLEFAQLRPSTIDLRQGKTINPTDSAFNFAYRWPEWIHAHRNAVGEMKIEKRNRRCVIKACESINEHISNNRKQSVDQSRFYFIFVCLWYAQHMRHVQLTLLSSPERFFFSPFLSCEWMCCRCRWRCVEKCHSLFRKCHLGLLFGPTIDDIVEWTNE